MDTPEHTDDLRALRAYRAEDAIPPSGLLDRLRDDLQLVIDAERSVPSPSPLRTSLRSWQRAFEHRLFRPTLVAAAAACLVVAVAIVSSLGNRNSVGFGATTSATQASASLFDGTAQRLFGGGASSTAPPIGVLDAADDPSDIAHAINDHSRDTREHELLARLSRDPDSLRNTVRMSARVALGQSATATSDQGAFILAMSLVTDAQLPGELRASMLRAVGGLDGIEAAAYVTDDLGRPGILISHLDNASGVRDQYVLNQSTGTLLERRSFTSAYIDPACPPGTFTAFRLFDLTGHKLTPAQLPTLAWPDVVTSCSPASGV